MAPDVRQLSPEEEIKRSEQARQILDSDLFKEAVQAVESALLTGIQRSAFSDEKLREKLAQRYALLHDLIDQIRSHIETGRLAEEELKQRTWKSRLKEAVGF
jgi:hypothetical protein